VVRVIEGRETEPAGWVRLTAPPGIATYVVAPLLPRLYERHPALCVELVPSVAYADLTRREADLAIRSTPPSSGDLRVTRLAEVGLSPFVSAERAAALGAVRSLDAMPWITWNDELAHLLDAQWIAANVSVERVVLRCSTFEPQVEAARAGLGAVMLVGTQSAGLVPLRLGRALRKRLPPWPKGSIYLVGHRALRDVPRVAAVWSFILEAVAAM
jgi:DNA-binding transcriptional LysR family regulator